MMFDLRWKLLEHFKTVDSVHCTATSSVITLAGQNAVSFVDDMVRFFALLLTPTLELTQQLCPFSS